MRSRVQAVASGHQGGSQGGGRVRRARVRAVCSGGFRSGHQTPSRVASFGSGSRRGVAVASPDETRGSALERESAAAARRDFDSAAASFTESMAAAEAPIKSPLAAVTLGERANAKFRLKALDDAIRDAEAAIASQEDHKPAYFTMAHALVATGRAEEAAARLKTLVEMDPSDETCRRHHEKAVFEVRKARRPDYYQILGVSALATVPEIKQAYKRKCMEWHPDRHAGAPEEQRAAAEEF